MRQLLSGIVAAGALTSALFFLKFWRASRDRLFMMFAAAFTVMAINHVALGLTDPESEARVYLYGARLVAFLLILAGIYDRNRN